MTEWSARNPFLVICLTLTMVAWGWHSLKRTPLDAIPDLSDVQVIILTKWPGQSPDLVEDQITYPISSTLLSAPGVRFVRGQSFLGLSFVYVIFEDGTDMYWARTRVLEYLNSVRSRLPAGIDPILGPDATGVGWVFQYALVDETGRHDLQELRSLQDYTVRYALESVPGVAEVAAVGGFVKQYEVLLDPNRLDQYKLTFSDVRRAIRRSNSDVGGRIIEISGHEHMIRGRGYIKSVQDLEQIPLGTSTKGVAVWLRDVATVTIGSDIRRGIAELNGQGEVVGGIVVMRYGENALAVIDRVKARIKEVAAGLPDGVRLEIVYDRSDLIKSAIATLKHTLLEEMLVVCVIIFIFLLHIRSSLVVIITLPVAVIMAFIPMSIQGLTANIMSLGGIAVAIGAMVDAAIILIENVHKKLGDWEESGQIDDRSQVVIGAMQEVGPSIFFSLLVMTVSFLPVFTLQATEGRLFKPLAFTKTYSLAFAALLSVTLAPALAMLLIHGKIRPEERHPLSRLLVALYSPIVRFVVRFRLLVVILAILVMVLTIPAFLRLESEFMPPLNEGAILYMPTAPPGMSITEAANVLQSMDGELKKVPEVVSVFGKMGRAQTATDSAPISMVEATVMLRPRKEWRDGLTWTGLLAELEGKMKYPGMPNVWWMPIQTRIEMLATGIRSPLGIKIFGDDQGAIEEAARSLEELLARVRGTRSAFAERLTGGFYLDIEIDREAAGRFGILVEDVHELVRSAIGGMKVSETIEGRERYPISVRVPRELRDTPQALAKLHIRTRTGASIPLNRIVQFHHRTGPPMIRSEAGRLVGFVFVDPGDRALGAYVDEARDLVAQKLKFAPGVRIEWAGQFLYLERARERLRTVLPLTLLLVFVLLYVNTGTLTETLIVLLAVPFSLVGAVWLLYLLDYHVSIAVWVGIIALAGLDAETGVVMLLYLKLSYRHAEEEGRLNTEAQLEEAIVDGAARRIRPKLMTVLTTMIGLLPLMWSEGTGADVMRRIAAPMIGGLVSSFAMELTVYPAIFAMWKGRSLGSRLHSCEKVS